ncbi:MAG: ATP-binding cassette domain-containing protein [Thermoplasmata archaeon]
MNIIETENLTKIYKGNIRAVDNLNLQIEEGSIYGLLGPNGAGKSTTIKMLTTVIKPTSGTATVAGLDIIKQSMEVRRIIGLVPQDLTTDEDLRGIENLMMVAKFYDVPAAKARENIDRLLKLVDLQDAAKRLVGQYSGGMRKRLELIAGLVHEPKILFLDEPTLGLDVQTRSLMWDYIKNIQETKNITIILTSHYLEEVDALSDKLSIINRGRLIVSGTPAELKNNVGGDILTMSFRSAEDMNKSLEILSNFQPRKVTEKTARFKVKSSEVVLPEIIEPLKRNGIEPLRYQVDKPSLDTVFMDYVGRALPEEEGEGDSRKMMMNLRRLRR